jgi:anti-sigma regulatory factor (Ser/Thr protein kinase)
MDTSRPVHETRIAAALCSSAQVKADEPYVASLTVPNRLESVRPAASFLVQTARALNVPGATKPLFEVAVTEAVTNAVKHGHSGEPNAVVTCELELTAAQLTLRITDGGRGFTIPTPTLPAVLPEQVERLPESGYGVPIIQSMFPCVRAIRVSGRFGLELCLPLR